MSIKCRFCGKMMECLETSTRRNGNEGVISGRFTCDCKEFIKNGKLQNGFDREVLSRLKNSN